MILNYQDLSDRGWFVMKIKQDNEMTDRIDATYVKNEIELSWPIGSGVVYDETQAKQWHDQSYKYDLHRKLYSTILTN